MYARKRKELKSIYMNNKTVEIGVSSVMYYNGVHNDYPSSVAYVRMDSIISVADVISVADERYYSRYLSFSTVMYYVDAKLQGVRCHRCRRFREVLQRLK